MYPFWKIFIYDYVLDLQIVQNCSYIGKRISPTRDCHCSLTIHFSTLFCCKIFSISGGGVGMAHLFTVTRNSLKYYFETSTLNVSRLNHGDFLPAFFCVLLRRFASRISELLNGTDESFRLLFPQLNRSCSWSYSEFFFLFFLFFREVISRIDQI